MFETGTMCLCRIGAIFENQISNRNPFLLRETVPEFCFFRGGEFNSPRISVFQKFRLPSQAIPLEYVDTGSRG